MPAATPVQAISTRLRATAAVTALVVQRVYPGKPPLNSLWPYVVVYKVGGGGGIHLGGMNQTQFYLVRVDVYAQTTDEAEAILEEVVTALGGWKDLTENVAGCFPEDDNDEQVADEGAEAFQVSGQTFKIAFRRS